MTFQISRRGKEYLETAMTLLRSAQAITDRAIADQLKARADDYQRRAEKLRTLILPKHWLDLLLIQKASDGHDPIGSVTAQHAKELTAAAGNPVPPNHKAFYSLVTSAELQSQS